MAEFIGAVVDQHGGEDVQLVPRAAAPASFIGGGEGADLAPRGTSFRHAGAEQWQRARPSRRIQHAYKGRSSVSGAERAETVPAAALEGSPAKEPASARRLASTGAAAEEVQGSAAGDRGAHQELGVKASDLHRDDRRFIKLQAILTVLPQHLLGWTGSSPGSEGKRGGELTHADLVEAALVKSCLDYPRFAKVLGRLVVAHASQDMAILVDHEEFQLFTCVRGTNPFVPRDLSDDARVIMGLPPARVDEAKAAYRAVCKRFPGYRFYGCGHSLGGSVMHELAYVFEKRPEYRFTRVDVFNAGASPFQRRNSALKHTVLMSHRVTGDLVSYFYDPAGGATIEHKERPQFGGAHWMGHFLPRRHVVADANGGNGDLSSCLTQ